MILKSNSWFPTVALCITLSACGSNGYENLVDAWATADSRIVVKAEGQTSTHGSNPAFWSCPDIYLRDTTSGVTSQWKVTPEVCVDDAGNKPYTIEYTTKEPVPAGTYEVRAGWTNIMFSGMKVVTVK